MPLCTRIDNRAPSNKTVYIKNSEGVTIATIEARSKSVELSITTVEGFYAAKKEEAILNA